MKSAAVQLKPDPARDLMDAYWLPFTPNRAFKKMPRVVVRKCNRGSIPA